MTDEAALLATVRAEPDNDLPRLVYADWLDECGRGRQATFIRRQIENANRDDGRTVSRVRFDGDTTRRLKAEPWHHVNAGHFMPVVALAGGRKGFARSVVWHRGFPALVGCTEGSWHTHHELITGPAVDVFFTGRAVDWGSLNRDGVRESVSLANPALSVAEGRFMTRAERNVFLFPNVREAYSFPLGSLWVERFALGLLHGDAAADFTRTDMLCHTMSAGRSPAPAA
jgi:uncharacterized protein (TIGR02996 family)